MCCLHCRASVHPLPERKREKKLVQLSFDWLPLIIMLDQLPAGLQCIVCISLLCSLKHSIRVKQIYLGHLHTTAYVHSLLLYAYTSAASVCVCVHYKQQKATLSCFPVTRGCDSVQVCMFDSSALSQMPFLTQAKAGFVSRWK